MADYEKSFNNVHTAIYDQQREFMSFNFIALFLIKWNMRVPLA